MPTTKRMGAKAIKVLISGRQRGAEKYFKPGFLYRAARFLEILWENKPFLKSIAKKFESQSIFNPVRPLPDVGGNPILHGVELSEKNVFMNMSERVGHTLVLGTTRVGKTRFLEIQVTQDIEFLLSCCQL